VRKYRKIFGALLFLALISASTVKAQSVPRLPDPSLSPGGQSASDSEEMKKWKAKMAKEANKERQADIQRDTEKLLKLATELKQYVDKTNENILSFEVVKKAEEIEKLAHSVKDKMKTSY
jgi:hypothetical protein